MFNKLLVFVFIVVLCIKSYAQNQVVFDQLSTKDGLSNGTIYSIFRDSKGFMWFCTADGINRYDGYSFKLYKSNNTSDVAEQNMDFYRIIEDEYGNLWIATFEGLFYLDRSTDQITSLASHTDLQLTGSPLDRTITDILYDHNHTLWAGSHDGLSRIEIKTGNIKDIKKEDIHFYYSGNDSLSISSTSILAIQEDSDHRIWFSAESNYLDCFDHDKQYFTRHNINANDIDNWSRYPKRIYIDKDDNFYIYTHGAGLFVKENWQKQYQHYSTFVGNNRSVSYSFIRSFLIDQKGRMWIGTDGNGIVLIDQKNNTIENFTDQLDDQSNLSSNAIYSLYQDQKGVIWAGTYILGLNIFDEHKRMFGTINSNKYSEKGLSSNTVSGFTEDRNGKIWISTDGGGINIYDRSNNTFQHFKKEANNPNSISTNTTMTIFCDNQNNIWVGSFNGGLNVYRQNEKKFYHYYSIPFDSTSIGSNHPWSIVQDKHNNIWIANLNDGLDLIKAGTEKFIHYTTETDATHDVHRICARSLTHLFVDSKNRLWISTEAGLDMVELDKVDFSMQHPLLTFNHFQPVNDTLGISYRRVSCTNEDNKGNIWIGTKGAGITIYNPETEKYSYYNTSNGLPHNIVKGILFDEENNAWISTGLGISKYNLESGIVDNFDLTDGLQSNFFIKTSYFKASDGMLFFGGINGFNAFYPDNIASDTTQLDAVITDFLLYNQSVKAGETKNKRILLKQEIFELNEIELQFNENDITFEFSALNYTNPSKVYYAYHLEGFDKQWHITDSKVRRAKYTNLAPGQYTFNVKASFDPDKWDREANYISVNVLPPWWMSLWFKITVVILSLLIFSSIFLYRIYALGKQKIILEQKVKEQTIELIELNNKKDKFFSILAHDLINPFNTLLGLTELILANFAEWSDKVKIETLKSINNSTNVLYELLINLLEWSRSERGLIEYSPEKLAIHNIIENIVLIQEITAQSKNIMLKTKFCKECVYAYSDKQLLNTIFRNLVSNAIKFTPRDGEILISTEIDNNNILVKVSDNGVGISEEKLKNLFSIDIKQSTLGTNNEKGTGLGLMLVKEFIELQKGSLSIISKVNQGSTFCFTVPLWHENMH